MKLLSIIAKAAEKAADEYTVIFQEKALEAGWPPYLVNQMSIQEKDGELYVDYPEAITVQVEDLEYGTQTSAPNSVIRTFLDKAHTTNFSDLVYAEAMSSMGVFA
jgi:hypothetical protein